VRKPRLCSRLQYSHKPGEPFFSVEFSDLPQNLSALLVNKLTEYKVTCFVPELLDKCRAAPRFGDGRDVKFERAVCQWSAVGQPHRNPAEQPGAGYPQPLERQRGDLSPESFAHQRVQWIQPLKGPAPCPPSALAVDLHQPLRQESTPRD
jgi:hypothetical protein